MAKLPFHTLNKPQPEQKQPGAVKPLDFGSVKKVAPPPEKQIVQTGFDPFNFAPKPAPPPEPPKPPAPPQKLDFSNVKPPATPTPVVPAGPVTVRAAFHDPTDTQVPDVIKIAEQSFPTVAKTFADKLLIQVKQLMPFKMEHAMTWGDKNLQKMAQEATTCANLIREVGSAKGSELLEAALESVSKAPGLLARLTGKGDLLGYKPRIIVLQQRITQWLIDVGPLVEEVKTTNQKLEVRMCSYSSVIKYLGDMPDDALELAASQRRNMLAQAVTQSQLQVAQMEQLQKQLIQMKQSADQLLNVTIPAFETANAR